MFTQTWLRDLIFYSVVIVLFSLLYALLAHMPFLESWSQVFYYRMNMALLITIVVAGVLLWGARKYSYKYGHRYFSVKDAICALLMAALLNFAFLSLILVSLDRSISVYLLSYMASHEEQSFTIPELEHIFLTGYIQGSAAMSRRMMEQIATGTVVEKAPDVYQITTGGKRMVETWRLLSEVYPVDKHFLYPQELPAVVEPIAQVTGQ